MELFIKKYLDLEKVADVDKFIRTHTPMQRLELLIAKSVSMGASDIHIEPLVYNEEDTKKQLLVQIRIRIGGDLKFFDIVSKNDISGIIKMGEDYDAYVRGIKLNLNLSGTDGTIPLDAAYSIKDEKLGTDVNLRFSFLPEGIELPASVGFFPKIVIRVLDNNKNIMSFEDIGLLEQDKNIIDRFLSLNQGFLIMAGPTGSGKTTTLYSMLQKVNKSGVNIQTVEDPIEYRIPGINQSKINNKSSTPYTFALALRSILRQDPDILLVGETRDTETGKIALEASSTGHLVFTTLHANSSIEIYSRLIQMEIEKFQVINGVNIGFSQRLLKKVCDHCGKKHKVDDKTKEEFRRNFKGFDFSRFTANDFYRLFRGTLTTTMAQTVQSNFITLKRDLEKKEYKLLEDKNNLGYKQDIEIINKKIYGLNEKIYMSLETALDKMIMITPNHEEGNNCEYCLGEGYKGRCPVFEIIPNTEELGELLLNNASKKELNRYVDKASIFTLKKYAFLLLIEGKTSFTEYINIS